MADTSIGIVIPVYRPDLEALIDYLSRLSSSISVDSICLEWDDPATDAVKQVEKEAPEVSIRTAEKRRGMGAAITDGFNTLDTEVLVFLECDGSTACEDVCKMIDRIRNGDADLAVGSRRHPDADIVVHQPLYRRLFGEAFVWMARQLVEPRLHDYQCAAKAVSRSMWREVAGSIEATGFAWDLELITATHAAGGTVEEVPITWSDHHKSTVSVLTAVPEMMRALVRCRRFENSCEETAHESWEDGDRKD